jgi:hypothetical protein
MHTLPTFFSDFLAEIRPTQAQRDEQKAGHQLLRKRLNEFDALKPNIISTFLQGSYRRATAVRPKEGKRSDVDVVVVTNFDSTKVSPKQAMDKFVPFLDAHYPGIWEQNDRSFSINLSSVKLDLVITAAPNPDDVSFFKSAALLEDNDVEHMVDIVTKSTGGNWKVHPLLIPDRGISQWKETHPIAQIVWTWQKNKSCNTHYVNVVKAIKWWRKGYDTPEYPKGYPVEHMIGQCCPDNTLSVAEGVTLTLEEMVRRYGSFVHSGSVPNLPDHGVPSHDVMKRVTAVEFKEFYGQVVAAAAVARAALDETSKVEATKMWQKLFGSKFAIAEKEVDGGSGGFTHRTSSTTLSGGRYG